MLPRTPRFPVGHGPQIYKGKPSWPAYAAHDLRYIKENLACEPMQLGSHVSKARTYVSKVPDVRAIMGLQNV
jgi:hypothetical protein